MSNRVSFLTTGHVFKPNLYYGGAIHKPQYDGGSNKFARTDYVLTHANNSGADQWASGDLPLAASGSAYGDHEIGIFQDVFFSQVFFRLFCMDAVNIKSEANTTVSDSGTLIWEVP